MERVATLDLLRGIAAFSVAIPHFIMLNTGGGWAEIVSVLAVEVFFVLSGFVLGPQILRCFYSRQASDLGTFLARRWMRTIPPYLFALVLISLIVRHIETADFARYAFYVENLFAQHNARDYFPVAWSLSIEEWFYLLFPSLLMIAAWAFGINRDRFAVFAALFFIGAITILRLHFGDLNDWGPGVRRIVVFRIDSIAYGFLLYMFVRLYAERSASGLHAVVFSLPVTIIFFIVAASLASVLLWHVEATRNHLAETLFPFAAAGFGMSAVILSYSARNLLQWSYWIAESCYLLGRVSYSLYLLHLCVAMLVAPYLTDLPVTARVSIYLVVSVALSAVFYHVFERPILAMRPNYRRSDQVAARDVTPLAARAKSVA